MSIREVLKTLAEAMLLVFLVVFVFLQNWRATLIPFAAVPVSLIGTFAGLYLLGYSINTLTLFGMVLAIGIVVDDAIVVLENVERIMREEHAEAREAAVKAMQDGEIVMLENVRFHPGETKNDPTFAQQLAALGDLYVNDAFGTAHRAHASTAGVAQYLPAVAGLLMEREIAMLGRIMIDPPHPLVAIIGGSKISTKIGVIRSLLRRVDRLCVGGAMACTFLKARGLEMGRSLVEDDQLEVARSLLASGGTIVLPLDAVVAHDAKPGVTSKTVPIDRVPADVKVLDVGPMTVERFLQTCDGAAAIVWNGPLGVYEVPPFDRGTDALAEGLAGSDAQTIIGGGDLVAALQKQHLAERMSFVSTGGGATLEFLEGKSLPGIAVLKEKDHA